MAERRSVGMDLALVGLLVGLLGMGIIIWSQVGRAREAAEQAMVASRQVAGDAAAARTAAEAAAAAVEDLRMDLDVLASGVGALERQVKEIADQQMFGSNFGAEPGVDPGGVDAPPGQPLLEYTPELREALARAVAAKGMTLLEDRVVVPGTVVLRQGALEFLAVFPGGKTHESILVLTGKVDEEGNSPEGLGAALNSCLMAIGLAPGTPIRILPGGRTIPAKGTPVYVSLEWKEEGQTVRVNAEDLLWDRERNRSLEPGKFLYVGSYFDPQGYVPDLTGDAVACYSVATCVVDLDDARAANDQIFVACGPRIPPEGTAVEVTFSRVPVEPTRTWDPTEPGKVTDVQGPDATGPSGGDAPGEGGGGGR